MKKTFLFFSAILIFACSYGQGEQLYADGTATDQDGNSFEWISYGSQDWAIENTEVVNYRDGTEIPQVTSNGVWADTTTGAWCYYNNDPTKPKLYNWYAVAGIHDNDPNTPNKEFAPEGWHVPTDAEWTTLEEYLIASGYNYDGTTTENKIAKAMASNTGWNSSTDVGAIGNDQSLNNSSDFNAFPEGYRNGLGSFNLEGYNASFWSSTENDTGLAWNRSLSSYYSDLYRLFVGFKLFGLSVRFVRDASTASTENNQSNTITIYPNPTTSILTIKGKKAFDIKVYDMTGRKIMTHTGNTIDMSNLSPATYIIKAFDNSNNEEFTYKVIKD
mgnify:CR=1 FL=1|jgi:uncharacterized protein (TIGR02145 family)